MKKIMKYILIGYALILICVIFIIPILDDGIAHLLYRFSSNWDSIGKDIFDVSSMYLFYSALILLMSKYIFLNDKLKSWQKGSFIFFVISLITIISNIVLYIKGFSYGGGFEAVIINIMQSFTFVNTLPHFILVHLLPLFDIHRTSFLALVISSIFIIVFNVFYGGLFGFLHDKISNLNRRKLLLSIFYVFLIVCHMFYILIYLGSIAGGFF